MGGSLVLGLGLMGRWRDGEDGIGGGEIKGSPGLLKRE